mmetsp:Transcript_29375/g.68419  ORF Transcript_29375/g.68419 Transcript_29375/m.68419 type:complete len:254 (+) Transcript_29375:299-1060(+)
MRFDSQICQPALHMALPKLQAKQAHHQMTATMKTSSRTAKVTVRASSPQSSRTVLLLLKPHAGDHLRCLQFQWKERTPSTLTEPHRTQQTPSWRKLAAGVAARTQLPRAAAGVAVIGVDHRSQFRVCIQQVLLLRRVCQVWADHHSRLRQSPCRSTSADRLPEPMVQSRASARSNSLVSGPKHTPARAVLVRMSVADLQALAHRKCHWAPYPMRHRRPARRSRSTLAAPGSPVLAWPDKLWRSPSRGVPCRKK